MDNVVYMIGEKSSRRFFNAHTGNFEDKITFGSFYPSRIDCEHVQHTITGSSRRHMYPVIEAEVLRFDGRELIVSYDDSFREESLQEISPF